MSSITAAAATAESPGHRLTPAYEDAWVRARALPGINFVPIAGQQLHTRPLMPSGKLLVDDVPFEQVLAEARAYGIYAEAGHTFGLFRFGLRFEYYVSVAMGCPSLSVCDTEWELHEIREEKSASYTGDDNPCGWAMKIPACPKRRMLRQFISHVAHHIVRYAWNGAPFANRVGFIHRALDTCYPLEREALRVELGSMLDAATIEFDPRHAFESDRAELERLDQCLNHSRRDWVALLESGATHPKLATKNPFARLSADVVAFALRPFLDADFARERRRLRTEKRRASDSSDEDSNDEPSAKRQHM